MFPEYLFRFKVDLTITYKCSFILKIDRLKLDTHFNSFASY